MKRNKINKRAIRNCVIGVRAANVCVSMSAYNNPMSVVLRQYAFVVDVAMCVRMRVRQDKI